MSSPPVSKQTPLPTSVTFGASAPPPGQVEEPRRLGGGGAHRLDHRQVGRAQRRAPRVTRDLGAVPRGERHERRLQRLRPHVAGRGVDQVLGQRRRRRRSARRRRGVDAVGADELDARRAWPRGSARSGSRRAASRAPRAPASSRRRPRAQRVAPGGQLRRRRPRGGSGRAPRACGVPQPTSAAATPPSGAGRQRTSPSPASKPIAATQARVGGVLAVRASRRGRRERCTCSGIARGSGAGASGMVGSLRAASRPRDSSRAHAAAIATRPIDRRRG